MKLMMHLFKKVYLPL